MIVDPSVAPVVDSFQKPREGASAATMVEDKRPVGSGPRRNPRSAARTDISRENGELLETCVRCVSVGDKSQTGSVSLRSSSSSDSPSSDGSSGFDVGSCGGDRGASENLARLAECGVDPASEG